MKNRASCGLQSTHTLALWVQCFRRPCLRIPFLLAMGLGLWSGGFVVPGVKAVPIFLKEARISASTTRLGSSPRGAANGDRFSSRMEDAWHAVPVQGKPCWWQMDLLKVQKIGALLQILGDHEFVFAHAPSSYTWQASRDGEHWFSLSKPTTPEDRCYRVWRFPHRPEARYIRFWVPESESSLQEIVLREVELYSDPQDAVTFPPWILAVNVTHDPRLPGHGQEFIPLAQSSSPEMQLQAQQVFLTSVRPDFLKSEPKPLAVFLSGSFKDWCEVDRQQWKGIEQVLRQRSVPMWASCGGAQALGILSEYGTRHRWDCPHCRDPRHPATPIYGHIGHTAMHPCGDYSGCVFERGPHEIRTLLDDPVFQGLPNAFQVMESHCGQLEWVPKGWRWIATAGQGTQTKVQCIRYGTAPVYAAQFHIEMTGTPEVSKQIMKNFLTLAQAYRESDLHLRSPTSVNHN